MKKAEIRLNLKTLYGNTSDIIKGIKQLEKLDWSLYKANQVIEVEIGRLTHKLIINYTNEDVVTFFSENEELQKSSKVVFDRYVISLEEV